MVYLDHNATTPLRPAARAAMAEVLERGCGNPSSVHRAGAEARRRLEEARRAVAEAVGARPAEVVFTSGGTESNNLAISGTVPDPTAAHVVVAGIEHSSVVAPARELGRRGAAVTWLPVDGEGRVDPAALETALRTETALVSIAAANGEIGTLQPIAALTRICRERGVAFHCDAAQAFGRIAVDLEPADLVTLSAHKMGGPIGAGALIVRRGRRLNALLHGGDQERGRRAGTENVLAIAGFAAAVADIDHAAWQRTEELRERLWDALADLPGICRNSPSRDCLPNTLNVSFAGMRGDTLVAALDLEGVAASVGSACAAGAAEPSHVLRALGRDDEEARSGLRFSLGRDTTAAEVDRAARAVRTVVGRTH